MGYREIEITLPTDYSEADLSAAVARNVKGGSFTIIRKSLDAREKRRIVWLLRVGVSSDKIRGGDPPMNGDVLAIPRRSRDRRALVVGCGPAGYFAASVLLRAGFDTTIIERGLDVPRRAESIADFERTGRFHSTGNYAFGEGGAGTFSDGKLTSRSKRIGDERRYVLSSYVEAGAPSEIMYLAHPHLGSDNLKTIVVNLRRRFQNDGGKVLFETPLIDLKVRGGLIEAADTGAGRMDADLFVLALGHSAFDTHRMLMRRGVAYTPKNFALGCRVEHPQALINSAQWGVESLPGLKAAEYRLTSRGDGRRPVYTFCMCPGGKVVPAAAFAETNIVNGMSDYRRDSPLANAACVAGITPRDIADEARADAVLDWLEDLELRFKQIPGDFRAPACAISDFMSGRLHSALPATSYPLGLLDWPLWEILPPGVADALRKGLNDFSRSVRGFETGLILGLESKTSSPVRVVRDESGRCAGFENLWSVGEGAGYSGGIISSAAEGIRAAMKISAEF